MLQITHLTVSFANQVLYQEGCFSLMKGEKMGIIGRNGSGKSTLLKIIAGKMNDYRGQVVLQKGCVIGYLDQHLSFTQPTLLEEALHQDVLIHEYEAKRILLGLGFTVEDFNRPIPHFSGGYLLRLHLAKVLLREPHLLLLDEPTNYLDLPSQQWLANDLKNRNIEILLVTHDRQFMDEICTHILGIHRGKLRKIKGTSNDYFQKIYEDELLYEKTRLTQEKKIEHLEQFINRFQAKATKAAQAQSRKKALSKLTVLDQLSALDQLDFSFNDAPCPSQRIVWADNLFFSYDEGLPMMTNLTFEIARGQIVAIIGKNGCGKSTLLKLIAEELKPTSGSLHFSPHVQKGIFGQTHIERLNPKASVLEEISQANPWMKREECQAICGAMLFSSNAMEKKIHLLSGGEKSRVLLGKIIAQPTNLLLLDEPTHHLDMESIEALIHAINTSESALVIVTHSEELLRRLPLDQIICCSPQKQRLFHGTYEEFIAANPHPFEDEPQLQKPVASNQGSFDWREKKERLAKIKKLEKQIELKENELLAMETTICQKMESKGFVSPQELKQQQTLQNLIEDLYQQLFDLDADQDVTS